MSFLKGLVNIINVVDKATNDEFEVTREGRRFKILVHGRFHHPSEPWVYDVTATDVITGTSEKIRHFERKEDGVNEATNAVLHALREKGVVGGVPMVTTEDRGQIALASRSEDINLGGAPAVFQYGIEPDVDGLYTSVLIPPAHPDQALLDPRSTYVTWESPRKGLVYILNNSHFPYLPDRSKLRRGSDVDLQNVKHVFSQLGFEPLVHQNLTRVEILSTLDETVNRINAEGDAHSSFCLFFMSHGNWEGVSGTDARPADHRIVTRDEIKAKLTGRRCKALLGKPKLIFIQACRGNAFTRNADELDAIGKSTTEVQDEEPPFEMDYVSATQPLRSKEQPFEVDFVPRVTPTPSPTIELDSLDSPIGTVDLDVDGGGELPNNSDMFVANATSNGYYSIRMRREGSWFIQAISEVFLAHAHEDDLNELMRKVTCLVTESYRSQFSDEVTNRPFEVRQTPAYECQGMRRRFYFLPKYP